MKKMLMALVFLALIGGVEAKKKAQRQQREQQMPQQKGQWKQQRAQEAQQECCRCLNSPVGIPLGEFSVNVYMNKCGMCDFSIFESNKSLSTFYTKNCSR